ncbi:MAG: metallophosphoesterase [Ignavibacteriae bacterium]|nr:metallophosphoesterase [Ignavibacteriota bacterium]
MNPGISGSLKQRNNELGIAQLHSTFGELQKGQSPSHSFKLVHISDPHLSRQFYREHIKSFQRLLREIIERGCDHLLITGDIVSTADPDDYYLAREILLKFQLLSGAKLTVVPGNHDIFGGPHRAVDILSFPRHIRTVDYYKHLDLFNEAFEESFEGCVPLHVNQRYPFVKKVGPFAILGLNSVPPWSLWNNPLGSNGKLDQLQVDSLKAFIGSEAIEGLIPIVAIHHHFNDLASDGSPSNAIWRRIEHKTMRMKKRRRLMKLLRSIGVQFIFHGHIHRNEIYEMQGVQCANGAGAVCDDPVQFLKFNTLEYVDGQYSLRLQSLSIPFQPATVPLSYLRSKNGLPLRRPYPATSV